MGRWRPGPAPLPPPGPAGGLPGHPQVAPGRAARALRRLGRGQAVEDEIVGYHLERAVRYRSELGPVDDQVRALARRAAGHLEAAGTRAHARGDVPAAVGLLQRASSLLPPTTRPAPAPRRTWAPP